MFKALVLEESEDKKVTSSIQELEESRLPEGDVLVKVEYSTLNYKDGMIIKGIGRLVREYPHVPGVDFAGVVESSEHDGFKPGDRVILTGWRVGETRWGGYAQKARVKGEWLVPVPETLSTRQAMAVGTAGLTAALAILTLEDHGLKTQPGEVLVTGAAGGVGSMAVTLLAELGYAVAASTGRVETHDYLHSLGAQTIVAREEIASAPTRPLDKERWAGCIDNVGGTTLAHVLTQMGHGSSVAAVGLAGGNAFESTVLPFLLRGVNLLGIDSVMCPIERRAAAWKLIADKLPVEKLEAMVEEHVLEDLPELAAAILGGQVRGRVVVRVD